MKKLLEEGVHEDLETFLIDSNVDYEQYLNIIRSSIRRPTVFLRRNIKDIWTNPFNPWIANSLESNMDLQFVLEEYSCAAYVVEYINKSNRGMSNLHRHLTELQNEYPDQDYTELLKRVSLRLLDTMEMSCQEAA